MIFLLTQRLRRLFLSLLLLLPLRAMALDASHGVHGMVLFGGSGGLYASHLPMLHAPHDKQVVLRVRFADPRLERTMRARLDGKAALWTLEPEPFALQRLAPGAGLPLRRFKATLVEGHFERDGSVRERAADLVVEQIVLFRPLAQQPAVRTVARYVPVGGFLVKLIDSRPDFDHIVLLERPVSAPVEVPKQGVDENLAALARLAPYAATVYYDSADLR